MAATVSATTPGEPQMEKIKDEGYVYFHSGSEATFRKVADKPSSFTVIPTIDIHGIDSEDKEVRKKIAKEIYDACHNCGFFYVKNHGIPQHVIDNTFATLERFFKLPLDVKMEAHVQKNPAIRGYEPMLETQLDPRTSGDIKEAFTMGDCVLEPEQDYAGRTGEQPPSNITKPQNIWPPKAPWWREGLYHYYSYVFPLSMKLAKIFALAFDLDESAFDELFKFPITGMRALYYPPTPVNENAHSVGLGAHSDFSWLTLVLQDKITALEVLNQDGIWIDAPPMQNTLVCNVGQYLERQTNGIFPATVHRVRNKTGQARYSLPFFLTMDPDAELGPLSSCVQKEGEAKYDKIKVGDLYIKRVLPARKKHPTSIKYADVPQEQWKYSMLLS